MVVIVTHIKEGSHEFSVCLFVCPYVIFCIRLSVCLLYVFKYMCCNAAWVLSSVSEHSTGLMYDENLPLNPKKRQCVIYIFTTCLHVDFNYSKVQIHTYTDIFTINMPAWWYVLINVFQTMSIYNLIYSYGECPLENVNTNLILYIKHMFITLYVYLWWKHE